MARTSAHAALALTLVQKTISVEELARSRTASAPEVERAMALQGHASGTLITAATTWGRAFPVSR